MLEISNEPFCRCHHGIVAETQSAKKLEKAAITSNFLPDNDEAIEIKPKLKISSDATVSPVISITPIEATARHKHCHNHTVDDFIDLKKGKLDFIPPFSVTHRGHRAMIIPVSA
jgi:hypothetical protein